MSSAMHSLFYTDYGATMKFDLLFSPELSLPHWAETDGIYYTSSHIVQAERERESPGQMGRL